MSRQAFQCVFFSACILLENAVILKRQLYDHSRIWRARCSCGSAHGATSREITTAERFTDFSSNRTQIITLRRNRKTAADSRIILGLTGAAETASVDNEHVEGMQHACLSLGCWCSDLLYGGHDALRREQKVVPHSFHQSFQITVLLLLLLNERLLLSDDFHWALGIVMPQRWRNRQ